MTTDQNAKTSNDSSSELSALTAATKEAVEARAKAAPSTTEAPSAVTEQTYDKDSFDKLKDEYNHRYGGLDTKLTQVTKDAQERETKLQEALDTAQTAQHEASVQAVIKRLEDAGSDQQATDTLVALLRENYAEKTKLAGSRRAIDAEASVVNSGARQTKVAALVKAHNLGDEGAAELLKLGTPDEMDTAALRMENDILKGKQIPGTKTDNPNVGSQKGVDVSGLSPEKRLGMIFGGQLS